jgi:hypothetical protein
MKFQALPVESFEEITLDLEQLQALLTTPGSIPLPFLQVAGDQVLQLAYGSSTVTFTASNFSALTAVVHNIGRVPVWVGATNSANNGVWFTSSSKTTTQVSIGGWFYTATSGTFSFDWVAIG